MTDELQRDREPAAPAPSTAIASDPPPAAAPSAAHCALHVDRLAAASCARCGTFLCAACAIRPEWQPTADYCKDCVVRLDASGAGGTVPWEDRDLSFPRRFARTLKEVIGAPQKFFARMAPHGYGPAISFQYTIMPIIVVLNLVVTWFRMKAMFGGMLSGAQLSGIFLRSLVGLVVGVALIPILHFIVAGWMHLHFLLVGSPGTELEFAL